MPAVRPAAPAAARLTLDYPRQPRPAPLTTPAMPVLHARLPALGVHDMTTTHEPPAAPLLSDWMDACDATAAFEKVAACYLAGRTDDALDVLREYLADGADPRRRVCEIALSGAIVTAALLNARTNPEGALWTLRPGNGHQWPSLPKSDFAAMQILTALLNHDLDAGRDLIVRHVAEHDSPGANGILAAMLTAYVGVRRIST
jgi:hypothetical protein